MTKGLAVFSMLAVAVVMAAGCTVHQADSAPPLTGPSQFALAVTMTANPDRISLDGGSQSLITAEVRGPNGELKVNVPLRVDMSVNGQLQDYGKLNARTIVTGTDGKAFAVYTAPALAAGANQPVSTVSIRVFIVGTDAAAAVEHTVDIRLMPPGVILPPADTPTASFVVTPTPVSLNIAASFDASKSCPGPANAVGCLPSSSATITNYSWSFGDGSTASGKAVTHTFSAIGTFNVTLTITNDRGITASTTQPITVSATDAPKPVFVFSPSAPGVNQSVNFNAAQSTAAAGRTITSYIWNFGDGSSGSGVAVAHAFVTAGTYNVTLTVTDDVGQKATGSQTVTVSGAGSNLPTASFTFSPVAPGVGENVFFNASQSTPGTGHSIASYGWTFGDGSSASGVTTSHAYTTAGSYSVQLKVTDEVGQTATSTQSVSPGSPPAPTSNFTFSPASPGRNDQVVFDASSSSTAQGQTIVDVAWNFGDGTPVIHCPGGAATDCPGPTNRISTHTFATATSFVVNLVVTDSAGRIGSHNSTVTVALAQPNVLITTSPNSPNPGTTVFFSSNNTTYFPGSGPATFAWTFGDGGTSTLANPTHTYGAVGAYSVGLSVTDNKGRTGVGSATVTVAPVTPPPPPAPPVAAFTFSPPSPSLAAPPVFFDASTSTTPSGAPINNYRWNFGDGTIISGFAGVPPGGGTFQAPRHTYAAVGSYTVTLTVTDTNSLSGSTTQTVTVAP